MKNDLFFHPGDTVQLLVRGDEAARVMDDWVASGIEADLRVRRARTEGRVVIETTDPLFASRVVRWFTDVRTAVKPAEKNRQTTTPKRQ